jgi:sugar O-acyltransferase (sialic acid O-acetyltransferase NeuD family)
MLIYGAGGHTKVILSCLIARQQPIIAIFDDDPTRTSLWDYTVVGSYQPDFRPDLPLLIGIGSNRVRQLISQRICHIFGQARHPSAITDPTARIGVGSVVLHGAIVQADARVGDHCIINTGASVDHDCQLADFVHIAPHATLCGNVQVGEGTLIGAGAVIQPNLTIGRWAVIGAGAVISKSVPDGVTVIGSVG